MPSVLDFFTVGLRTAERLQEAMAYADFSCGMARPRSISAADAGARCCGSPASFRTSDGMAPTSTPNRWSGAASSIPGGVFSVNGPLPPLPYADGSFDLIYGVSVFTHLSEEHQRAWLPELRRILKPGGLLLLSFHSKNVWQPLEDAGAVERDGFVFRTSAKLQGILPEWYQTAFQSRPSIVQALSAHFTEVGLPGTQSRRSGRRRRAESRRMSGDAVVEVVAAVMMRDGKILIGQRKRGGRHPLKWEFPGGKVEPGEDPRAALARELREELDVEAVIGEEMDSYEVGYGDGFRVAAAFLPRRASSRGSRAIWISSRSRGSNPSGFRSTISSKGTLRFVAKLAHGRPEARRDNVERERRRDARAHADRHGLLRVSSPATPRRA